MQAANNAQLISFRGWTLRVRPAETPHPRFLILLHGWTGDENSMWIFARALSPSYWILAPRAPHPAPQGGYSWRPHDPDSFGRPSAEKLKPAADALIQLMDEYAASVQADAAQFDLMGFSQGAAMANLLALHYPQRVRKMAILSGFVPSGAEELVRQKPLTGKQIFVAHGTQDELIPLDRARASIALLEQAGARVTYCQDDVGHKVSSACKRALEVYLKD